MAASDAEHVLSSLETPLALDSLARGRGPWEVEIGFGKGRYLLRRATAEPARRFLGIEVSARYYRRVRDRSVKRGLSNLLLVRGEALYALSVVLPRAFANAVHVYFPDPWPKARHEERRLFDAASIDLLLALLKPGGVLFFATDFLDYADVVAGILDSHPGVTRRRVLGPWGGESRTNYEAKYIAEGRSIARFEVTRIPQVTTTLVHPAAQRALEAAVGRAQDG